jgi:hypothetical protein
MGKGSLFSPSISGEPERHSRQSDPGDFRPYFEQPADGIRWHVAADDGAANEREVTAPSPAGIPAAADIPTRSGLAFTAISNPAVRR